MQFEKEYEPNNKYSLKKVSIYGIIVLLLSAVTFMAISSRLSEAKSIFADLNWSWVTPIIALMTGVMLFGAVILYALTKVFKSDYTFLQALKLNVIGLFFNAVTPLSSGGQVMQLFVLKKQGVDKRIGLSILLFKFIITQVVLVSVTTTLFIIRSPFYFDVLGLDVLLGLGIVGFASNFLVLMGLFFTSYSERFQLFIKRILLWTHKLRKTEKEASDKKIEKYHASRKSFREGMTVLLNHKVAMTIAFTAAIAALIANSSVAYFSSLMVNAPINSSHIYDSNILTMFVRAVNTFNPIPGGTIGTEYTYTLVFGSFFDYTGNLAGNDGLNIASASMVIWRISTFTLPVVIGFLTYVISRDGLGIRKRKSVNK